MNMVQLVSMSQNVPFTEPADIMVVPTTAEHIRKLAKTIRENDRREIEAYGFSCEKGLWHSFKKGLMNKTAFIDGEVAACWGVAGTYMGETAMPWLLTGNAVYKISPLKFTRIYQKEVYKMLELFPILSNYVLADYDEAVRLLSIIGFEIGEPEKQGNGMYRKFTMKAKD